ncbi:YfcE family phosphodiesterase [bacterium]|nr:YfcE family phosphodiesterase [bacterium]MBU1881343.1 YfcE family phosphodiesterase [bacterium]
MTRILVLSDTHFSHGENASNLLADLDGYLQASDLIIHAGDHTSLGFYAELMCAGNIVAVHGNMDVMPLRHELPDRTVVECEHIRIGITHGWGSASGLPERVYQSWSAPIPELLIFGHSHRMCRQKRGNVLLFNPGSATSPRSSYASVGWIEISGSDVKAEHVQLPRLGRFP